jgi:hypothetical protein
MLVIEVGVKFRTVSVNCANIFDQDCNPGQKSLAHLVQIIIIIIIINRIFIQDVNHFSPK